MEKEFGYYLTDEFAKVDSNGKPINWSLQTQAAVDGLVSFITADLVFKNPQSKVFKLLAIPLSSSTISTGINKAIAIEFDFEITKTDDDLFEMVVFNTTSIFSSALLSTALAAGAVTAASALAPGVAIVGLSAIGMAVVGVTSTFVMSFAKNIAIGTMEAMINGIINPNLADEVLFFDQSGKHASSVFYPDGLDGTIQQNENAVRDFIFRAGSKSQSGSLAGSEIINGGTIKIQTSKFDFQLDTTFTLYNAGFIDRIVELSSVSIINDFLIVGDKKNLDSHAFKEGTSEHYFFFEDNDVAIDIPVVVNGVIQIVTVNNVYGGIVSEATMLMGNGSGVNLVMGLTNEATTIIGSSGENLLLGGSFGEQLNSNDGNDTILGQGGNDIIIASEGDDVIDGGEGIDLVDYSSFSDDIFVNILSGVTTIDQIFDESQILYNIENINTGSGDDTIIGNDKNNELRAGAGKDSIDGRSGDDKLFGGSGDDTIHGGIGDDVIDGGADNDFLVGGNDNDKILGDTGNDFLDGGAGNDLLIGGAGNDKLIGGADIDTLAFSSSFGSDAIIGGAGDIDSRDIIEVNNQSFSGIANKNSGSDDYVLLGKTIQILTGDVATEATIKIIDGANSIEVQNFTNGDYGITLGKVDDSIVKGRENFDRAQVPLIIRRDPLVIDLDGDGVELISADASNVYFDLDGDGTTEKIGWVASDDALFALDRNGNGTIDNINELFGSPSQTGFEELAILDSNADRVINIQDAAFSDILVWQDKNSNGVAEVGEIKTLMQVGISSVSLDAEALDPERVVEGNFIPEISEATLYGQENEVAEVLLTLDTTSSLDQPDGSGIATLPETLTLPQSRGYGSLLALDKAMSVDPVLLTMMQDFVAVDITTITASDLTNAVRNILFQWADVAHVDPASRGSAVDGQELAFLERIFGSSYLNGGSPNPSVGRLANEINQSWTNIFDVLSSRLSAQGPMVGILQGVSYDAVNDELMVTSTFLDVLNLSEALGLNSDLRSLIFDAMHDLEVNSEVVNTLLTLPREVITTLGRYIVGTDYIDNISGSAGNDVIIGAKGYEFSDGGAGDDIYFYNTGDGAHHISDGEAEVADNNVLQFGASITREDIILEYGRFFKIRFKDSFADSVTSFRSSSPDFSFGIDTIRFEDGTEISFRGIDNLITNTYINQFTGSSQIIGTGYDDHIRGGEGSDRLYGSFSEEVRHVFLPTILGLGPVNDFDVNYGSDTIEGGRGHDSLYASGENIFLDGGEGNDTLWGNAWFPGNGYLFGAAGNDIIHGVYGNNIFVGGSGNDILEGFPDFVKNNVYRIEKEAGATDRIKGFSISRDKLDVSTISAASLAELKLSQDGANVSLNLGNNNVYIIENTSLASLTDNNFIFTGDDLSVRGTFAADIIKGFEGNDTLSGGNGDDALAGRAGNDQLDGDEGNDILSGEEGNDKLFGDLGDDTLLGGTGNDFLHGGNGNDTLNGEAGNDELHGGQGEDTYVFAAGGGFDTITDTGGVDTLKLEGGLTLSDLTFTQVGEDLVIDIASGVTIIGQFSDDPDNVVEFASFDDGTIVELPNTLLPVNQSPIARNDGFSLDEDSLLINNVLINDNDPNEDVLSVQPLMLTTATGASVELLASGDFIYTSALNFNGVDSFDYTLLDPQGESDSATVMIVVNPVNDNPEARDDLFASSVNTALSGNVLADNGNGIDSDNDLDPLAVQATTFMTAAGATVILRTDGSFDYTPVFNSNDNDSFNYTLVDGQGGSALGTVSIVIDTQVVNNPPEAKDDSFEGEVEQKISGNLLNNDFDIDNNSLTAVAANFTTLQGGLVSILESGEFTYNPTAGFFGADSFDYTVIDNQGGQDSANVSIAINESISEINGTVVSDYLVGSEQNDIIRSLGGNYDKTVGGLGADIFVFGSETKNGIRERDIILDYEVGIDSILLENGASVGSIRQTSSSVAIFFEGDRDAAYVQGDGVLVGNLTFNPEDIILG